MITEKASAPAAKDLIAGARKAVHAFARKLCKHDHALAEDITQDALETAYRKYGMFDPTRGPDPQEAFVRWTNTILLNKYRDYLRSSKRREIQVDIGPGYVAEDAEEVAMRNLSLSEMLNALAPLERQIAKLLSEGMGPGDVQERLAIGRTKYAQIVRQIRVKLGGLVSLT